MHHKEVRDLAWVINSPSMVKHQAGWPTVCDADHSAWINSWLLALDKKPHALQQHLAKEKSHFLGTYFESLWAFYIEAAPNMELIARNLQVTSPHKKTLGEFDFIVLNNVTGQLLHQEIAIKFYLGLNYRNDLPFTSGNNLWVGPQCRDRLDLKVEKLINAQTQLSKTEHGRNALKKLNTHSNIDKVETQLILKGYLFYPSESTTPITLPDYCNPNHLHGDWFPLKKISHHLKNTNNAWCLLPKEHWISPLQYALSLVDSMNENITIQTNYKNFITSVNEKIIAEKRPWMIASLTLKQDNYVEDSRFFVVPDDWPSILI